MRPTIIIWTVAIIVFIIISRVCNSNTLVDIDNNYNNPNRQYVAGSP